MTEPGPRSEDPPSADPAATGPVRLPALRLAPDDASDGLDDGSDDGSSVPRRGSERSGPATGAEVVLADSGTASGSDPGTALEVVPAPGTLAVDDRRPDADAAPAGEPRSSDPAPVRPPVASGALARRVLALVSAPLVALLVGGSAAVVLTLRADASRDRADELSAFAVEQRGADAALDGVWSGVLAVVAGGVGQQVGTVDEVIALSGRARADIDLGAPASAEVGDRAEQAGQVRADFLDAVDAALEESGDSPVELGNALDVLADRRAGSVAASQDLDGALRNAATSDRKTADRYDTIAVVAALAGVLVAAVLVVVSRRRLIVSLDRPLTSLRDAVRRAPSGARVGPAGPGAAPEIQALAQDLHEALTGMGERIDGLRRRAEWGEQSRMIFEALDLADDEPAAYDVIRRALAVIDPTARAELLLAERGSTRLRSVAGNPHLPIPGCPVESTGACVALRRGQVSVFTSSESINTCPKLRDRPDGPCSAACVPVTVAARPVGVLHMTSGDGDPPQPHVVEQLVTLSTQLGNRLGALRTLETTRQEASTDGLTGLPNRRTLEAEVNDLLDRGTPFVMVLADLDKFKRLNDNFGHEVGDKALQLFAGVLRDNVRGNDVVARLGGEEFVLVHPNMSVEISIEAIARLRQALARAVAASHLPPFTCSFGVTHSSVGADGDAILRIADAGLLRAKDLGGDQAVFADAEIAAAVFRDGGAARARTADDRR